MTVNRDSRHGGLPTYRVPTPGRATRIEIWQPRLREVPGTTRYLEVREDERLDGLAFRALGDAYGFWQLADANRVYDPRSLLVPSRIIGIAPRRSGNP